MKITLGPTNCLYPMPVVLLGANVNGKSNYMTIAWDGIVDFNFISVSITKTRYTYAGIKENNTFSINIPSLHMLVETDYCGTVSGKNVDKSKLFQNFYGKLETAPMIEQCPINMECRLVRIIDGLPTHEVFIGEIVETYCDEEYRTNDKLDWQKMQPILYIGTNTSYWTLGKRLGEIGSEGRKLKRS